MAEFEYPGSDSLLVVPKEDAVTILEGDHPDFDEREDRFVDKRRWCEERTMVVKHMPSGKYYQFEYERGLTECQDDHPTFHGDMVNLYRVEPVEVVTVQWRQVVTGD